MQKSHKTITKIREFLSLLPEKEAAKYSSLLKDPTNEIFSEFLQFLRKKWSQNLYFTQSLSYTILPDWYEEEVLEMDFSVLSEAEKEMEYLAQWVADSGGPFKASLLEHATDSSLSCEKEAQEESVYVVGIDPASRSNMFAVVILKLKRETTECIFVSSENNLSAPKQVRYTYDIANKFWPIDEMRIDLGGGGDALSSDLEEQKDSHDCWDGLGPLLKVPNEEEAIDYSLRGDRVVVLQTMNNEWVTAVNIKIIADMERGLCIFAGDLPEIGFEDVYEEIAELKKEMTRLIRIPAGNSIKFDLPGKTTEHNHDRWSAFTLAYGSALAIRAGKNKNQEDLIGMGFWDSV